MKNTGMIAGVIAATLGLSNAAHADCWSMLQKHFTWAQSDVRGENHQLTFQLVTNNSGSLYTAYTTGVMDVTSDDPWLFNTSSDRPGTYDGFAFFSDRQYLPCYSIAGCPFNRDATDRIGVRITWWGQVTFTLKSWGGGELTGTGECTNEMLITHIGDTAFVFSFKETSSPVIY